MPAYKECTTFMVAISASCCDGTNRLLIYEPGSVQLASRAGCTTEPCLESKECGRGQTVYERQAVELTGSEFSDRLSYIISAWFPARGMVVAAMEARKLVHPSGKVLALRQACPWKVTLPLVLMLEYPTLQAAQRIYIRAPLNYVQDHLYDVEKEMKIEDGDLPIYSLFPEGDDPGTSTWRIQGIPKAPGSFETRNPMPEAYVLPSLSPLSCLRRPCVARCLSPG
ncbi:MAG: hypothetical protein BJ554DRAFT_5635 [Olpidium bornovanus]|uniref:Uncharacterized protein n=1 Tax=Olpidium bornovanus TaxID=278681 RepID=A0A8H7ZZ31_9FUNG|nr:MAG: hypothetical protein BJ554DRAFT_5635 [Olpidium bornovanus]